MIVVYVPQKRLDFWDVRFLGPEFRGSPGVAGIWTSAVIRGGGVWDGKRFLENFLKPEQTHIIKKNYIEQQSQINAKPMQCFVRQSFLKTKILQNPQKNTPKNYTNLMGLSLGRCPEVHSRAAFLPSVEKDVPVIKRGIDQLVEFQTCQTTRAAIVADDTEKCEVAALCQRNHPVNQSINTSIKNLPEKYKQTKMIWGTVVGSVVPRRRANGITRENSHSPASPPDIVSFSGGNNCGLKSSLNPSLVSPKSLNFNFLSRLWVVNIC